jgi:catechol 2,3-dioxygenase-like lactoylglutathione lyase family enzyme
MASLGYVTIGTNDLDRAVKFYDDLLADIGGKRVSPTPNGFMYMIGTNGMFTITKPYDKAAATAGNGVMVAFQCDNKEQVAGLHAKALALGGKCEGQPGKRGDFGTFSYFRDLDGNKLAAYVMGQ